MKQTSMDKYWEQLDKQRMKTPKNNIVEIKGLIEEYRKKFHKQIFGKSIDKNKKAGYNNQHKGKLKKEKVLITVRQHHM